MAKPIQFYKGFHSKELYQLLQKCWQDHALLIVGSATSKDLSWIEKQKIPEGAQLGVFTSGTSTGQPRLILYSRENILSSLKAIRKLFDTARIQEIFCYPQPSHTFGLLLGYMQSIIYQIPIHFAEGSYSSKAHAEWFEQIRAGTLTLATPTHFRDLMTWLRVNKLTPKKSYSCIMGGAPVSQKLWVDTQNILNIEMPSVGYGASEASPGISHLPPGIKPLIDGDIGFYLEGVTIHKSSEEGYTFSGPNKCLAIIDETGTHLPEKVEIRDSLAVMPVDKESPRLVFQGRTDFMINRGGVKFSPEVVTAKLICELNSQVYCVSIFDPRLQEDLGILVAGNEFELRTKTEQVLQKEFGLNIPPENIVFCNEIPMNANLKPNQSEAVKLVLRQKNITKPIPVGYLLPFLPHRASAVWVHRITQFSEKIGQAELDLSQKSNAFTHGQVRETACIELVAQTLGYSMAATDVFTDVAIKKASKTFIAEVKNMKIYFNDDTKQQLLQAGEADTLIIDTNCTHDFGQFKVVVGKVSYKETLLAELSLKVFVA